MYVNVVTREFFDAYLRGGPKPRFGALGFTELRVSMNDRAGS